jgi:DnaJ like chaperone protein
MDASQYYITTLTAAFKNLAPIAIFLLGGYIVFIKLPFLFFLKSMKDTKQDFEQNQRLGDDSKKSYKLEDYEDFQRRMKLMGPPKEEPKKEEPKKEEPKAKAKAQEKKKEEPKKEQAKPKPKPQVSSFAEELFELKPGQTYSQQELKKKYYDLLKMNHPDKVASMGPDFKKMAEMKTKDINTAYMKLKKLAA